MPCCVHDASYLFSGNLPTHKAIFEGTVLIYKMLLAGTILLPERNYIIILKFVKYKKLCVKWLYNSSHLGQLPRLKYTLLWLVWFCQLLLMERGRQNSYLRHFHCLLHLDCFNSFMFHRSFTQLARVRQTQTCK